MVKNHVIAYYPYSYNTSSYHGLIQEMIAERYFVIDYNDVKRDTFQLQDIDAIYLNWMEDVMDDYDRTLILKAAKTEIKVFWVFHNKVSHDKDKEKKCRSNITFLLENVTDIIVLSHSSIRYLYEYSPQLDQDKIHYLPHPEYIGNYGTLENTAFKKRITASQFVFGCIGNLRPDKNIELVIKAFKQFPYREESCLFIVGRPDMESYLLLLEKLIGDDENIILLPDRIPDYMMNFYVDSADVLVLPYDVKSCINSGVMLLAFTNKRTVIVSDICMTEEFNDALFYRYSYKDDEDHIVKLAAQMAKAYTDGKTAVRTMGAGLYDEIINNNLKKSVKSRLYEILDGLSPHGIKPELLQMLNGAYRDKDSWYRRYMISDAWLRNVLSGNTFMEHLKENPAKRIAIYGFGKYGKMLYREMQRQGISIVRIIDQNADKLSVNVPTCTLDTLHEKLDIVVVTVVADICVIRTRCQEFNENCHVFNLGDI